MKEKNMLSNTLWYNTPAQKWTEAVPLGNGRIGAMVHSIPKNEVISLNEDTLWSGYPKDNNVPGADECYKKAIELIAQGKSVEAQAIIENGFLGTYGQSFLPLGELLLSFEDHDDISDFYRELSLTDAVVRSRYRTSKGKFSRESFVSAPNQALVMRFSADSPSLSFSASFGCQLHHTVSTDGNRLILEGLAPSNVTPNYISDEPNPVIYEEEDAKKGMRFQSIASFEVTEGTITQTGNTIVIANAREVIIRLCARTSFAGFQKHPYLEGADYHQLCEQDLAGCAKRSYDDMLVDHSKEHQSYFSRMTFGLSGINKEHLPTNQRLLDLEKDNYDAGLFNLILQYGRYLLVASSRPGTQAANLQGIWNDKLRAPWSGNYTVNINAEMNYWPAERTNLSEMHGPLFDLIEKISVNGRKTAQVHYGASGFVAHHNVDLWGLTSPVGNWSSGSAGYGFWGLGAGWLCRHLFEHYEYTLDRDFLQNTAWPYIKGCTEFFLDVLTKDNDGYAVFAPSTSPENAFIKDGVVCCVSQSTAMTQEIIRETFENALACCDLLALNSPMESQIRTALASLRPLAIGAKGQLQEWDQDYEEREPTHRHVSHLYPLHPAHAITPETTPELAHACATSLNLRGDDATGWGLGWRINLWARLKDGNRALKLLRRQLNYTDEDQIQYSGKGGTLPNLMGTHPPFQIDGNFGATAGITEMFLQSRGNQIELLPALPDEFEDGYLHGLCAHGGLTVSIDFEKNKLATARIVSSVPTHVPYQFCYHGKTVAHTFGSEETLILTLADFA